MHRTAARLPLKLQVMTSDTCSCRLGLATTSAATTVVKLHFYLDRIGHVLFHRSTTVDSTEKLVEREPRRARVSSQPPGGGKFPGFPSGAPGAGAPQVASLVVTVTTKVHALTLQLLCSVPGSDPMQM